MNSSLGLEDLLKVLESAIDLLPDTSQQKLKQELQLIRELIMKARPPKLVVVGRRGAGKSSLINAIFTQKVAEVGSVQAQTARGQWYRYQNARGRLEILDTRGLGDRTRPDEQYSDSALALLKKELSQNPPDVLIFLVKAKEVDSRISEDLENVKVLLKHVQSVHKYDMPVMALLTQVDELDPLDVVNPPYEDDEKQANIQKALGLMEAACTESDIPLLKSLAISAYARFKEDEIVYNRFWNIDTLIQYLIEALPQEAKLELARLSQVRAVQKKIARLLIASSATICAGLAAIPLPLADIVPITSAQIALLTGIAYVSGRELNQQSALEFMAAMGVNVGAGFALREVSRALAKFIFPGGGTLISSGIAFAATWGIGEAAIAYFIEGESLEQAREKYQESKSKHERNS